MSQADIKEAEVKEALRNWILKINPKTQANLLNNQTAIIEERIISSLQIMDLILFLEKLSGQPLEIENLKPGVFKNIDSIYSNFFQRQDN